MKLLERRQALAVASFAGMLLVLLVGVLLPNRAHSAQTPDWAQVEQALGRTGQLMPGDVFRIGMPRSDLQVAVEGVPVEAGFALGSYAAFKYYESEGKTMVMGDLVLLDEEVPAVMSGLIQNGITVTALHNHLN